MKNRKIAIFLAGVLAIQPMMAFAKGHIGIQKAKEIALKEANVKSSEAHFEKAQIDTKNGIQIYDIEFFTNTKEYGFEIDAISSKILKIETENQDHKKIKPRKEKRRKTEKKKEQTIGIQKAKEIALNDAGLSVKEVSFIKAKLDKDDGTPYYDVEFYYGYTEYEYKVDTKTGTILERNIDQG